jgi:hypothetical protein
MFGAATINGAGSFDFVVDVDDFGEPGAGVDKFQIQLSNGYGGSVAVTDVRGISLVLSVKGGSLSLWGV